MNIEEEESTRMRVNRKDQEMMEKSETKTRLIQQKPKETKSKFKKPTMEKKKERETLRVLERATATRERWEKEPPHA
jgi:hypothetical protein